MLETEAEREGMVITMPEKNAWAVQHRKLLLFVFALILLSCGAASAQTTGPVNPDQQANPAANVEEYKIGPDDVLLVSVADAPEFGGKFRVSEAGLIEIAGISKPIHAEGQSALQLTHEIRVALIEAKQLRDPRVSIFIEEYHGRTITVLGAVNKPAVYSLQRRTTVLDALSMASGTLPNAGSTVTIVRGRASAEATGTTVGSVQIIDMSRLVKGEDAAANVEVRNEDVISVSAAQVVYVVGAVTKPGGFTMSNPSEGISVVQAIALAEGFRPVAATHRGVIVRQSTNDQVRREIPVDIAQMMAGKETDLLLAPNDILYVPESGGKKALKAMGDVAMAAVNGIAIYGLGYRIGTH
jgi:polysaccharide export outer membrane protein